MGRLHFVDITKNSGIDFTTTSGKTPSTQILEVKGGGLALLDFDGDGDYDLFVPNGATLDSPKKGPGCRFYENISNMGKRPAIHFRDITSRTGIAFDRWGFGSCALDYDGDGKDDLYVSAFGENSLYHNLGGKFEDATAQAGVAGGANDWTTATACGDIDQDGDLDLYVVNYIEFDPKNPPPETTFMTARVFGGPMGLKAQPDRVFVNRGDGTFEDATSRLGFDKVEPGYGLGAVILDFDGDGKQDIFVGNDSGKNNLFMRKADGSFEDLGVTSGIATNSDGIEQATMGIAIGDVNGDQLADVFSTNFMNDTNTLHVYVGKRQFSDQTPLWGLGVVSRPYLKWATGFYDFDHDGDEDIVVFDGHVYPKEITEPRGWMHDQVPQLFRRTAGKRFELVSAEEAGPWLKEARCDRSAVFDDLDLDGDIDMIVNSLNEPIRVLENDGAKGPWTIVALLDRRPDVKNHHGIGSKIVVDAGGVKQTRWVYTSGGYQSSNPPQVHFGLPLGTKTYTVDVTWPDGTTTKFGPQPIESVDTLTLDH